MDLADHRQLLPFEETGKALQGVDFMALRGQEATISAPVSRPERPNTKIFTVVNLLVLY